MRKLNLLVVATMGTLAGFVPSSAWAQPRPPVAPTPAGKLPVPQAAGGQGGAQSQQAASADNAQQPATEKYPVESPHPTGAGAVTLEEAVKRAIAHNPNAEVATQDIIRSEALVTQVRSTWLPTLNATGTYLRLDNDRRVNGAVAIAKEQEQGNITATVPIISPKQWVNWSRAKDNVEIAQLAAADTKRTVAIQTARAYLTIIAQRRVLESAQRALSTNRAHEDYAVTRFEGGIGNRLDAVRASTERATSAVQVKNQLNSLQQAQEALGVLMGADGSVDAAVDPNFGAPPSVESAISEAGHNRADVEAQRRRVRVAHKSVRDSWADYMPIVTGTFAPFYQNPPTFTQPQTGYQAQLVVTLPLYDGGLRYGLSDERKALEAEAKSRLDGVLRQARSEVRTSFEALQRADEALAAARDAAKMAHEASELAQLAYQAGATTNIEVVDAERRAEDSDIAVAVAEDSARQARLDLLSASGRFPGP